MRKGKPKIYGEEENRWINSINEQTKKAMEQQGQSYCYRCFSRKTDNKSGVCSYCMQSNVRHDEIDIEAIKQEGLKNFTSMAIRTPRQITRAKLKMNNEDVELKKPFISNRQKQVKDVWESACKLTKENGHFTSKDLCELLDYKISAIRLTIARLHPYLILRKISWNYLWSVKAEYIDKKKIEPLPLNETYGKKKIIQAN